MPLSSVPGSAYDGTAWGGSASTYQSEPAIHAVPGQSAGTRMQEPGYQNAGTLPVRQKLWVRHGRIFSIGGFPRGCRNVCGALPHLWN